MGGGVWQDNFDGTFTQLDDDYYVPATGYSYLDLYLMGLISPAEVPDFFILRQSRSRRERDANGHPIFKADRTKVTIQDVIAAEGPRLPGVDKSQRQFNTGMVIVVQQGAKPSPHLIERTKAFANSGWNIFPSPRAPCIHDGKSALRPGAVSQPCRTARAGLGPGPKLLGM